MHDPFNMYGGGNSGGSGPGSIGGGVIGGGDIGGGLNMENGVIPTIEGVKTRLPNKMKML